MDENKPVEFEMQMGTEYMTANIDGNQFFISTNHSEEIEEEIVEKLDKELNKKYPSICESFKPRVTKQIK
jgi:hypothetical protein